MLNRTHILDILKSILERQGKSSAITEADELRAIGFRSLDFSELALRVETAAGKPLTFDAAPLRAIQKVSDVLDFFESAVGGGNAAA